MNNSSFEINENYNNYAKKNSIDTNKPSILLDPEQHAHIITHKIHTHLEEDISDFVFQVLKTIERRCEDVNLAGVIVKDFECIHYKKGLFAKIFNWIMVAFHLRHSEQEIRVLHRSIKAPSLGDKTSPDKAEVLIKAHRHPSLSSDSYDKVALCGIFFENKLKELLSQHAEEIKLLKEPQLSIFKAHLKEQAIKDVYQKELPKRIQEGYYNPAIIPLEIEQLLGPAVKVPRMKLNADRLETCLEMEAKKYVRHLTEYQLHYIQVDVIDTIKLYLKAYPGKSCRDAFTLGRDLIRIAVYQEIFDKGSFSGSDHGSKHIHHNIKNAGALHSNMQPVIDYNEKDLFIERMVHFYHDVGYTTGLSAKSFSCCKDHPLIGAKMIEENKEYFEYYLDQESAAVLWNSVLLHAIAMPDLTPDVKRTAGMYPGMVRAITSVSDACAVTYDRKTQEFWEQPETLLALARLRLFLTQYPQYIVKLAVVGKGEWESLDQADPLDVLAHDVFQHAKHILLKAVEKSKVVPQKKELFRQAILQQFNSFTTATTLGQLGGMLIDVSAYKNEKNINGGPKFFPQFDMAPSMIYGTLFDLFGPQIAQASFKKLAEEFGGDLKTFAQEIDEAARRDLAQPLTSKIVNTGNARFKILSRYDLDPSDKHLGEMQGVLYRVAQKVNNIALAQYITSLQKNRVMQAFVNFRQGKLKNCTSFSDFVSEYILPNLSIGRAAKAIKEIELLTIAVKDEVFQGTNPSEKQMKAIENAINLILTSEEEYRFMRGKKSNIDKSECLEALQHIFTRK